MFFVLKMDTPSGYFNSRRFQAIVFVCLIGLCIAASVPKPKSDDLSSAESANPQFLFDPVASSGGYGSGTRFIRYRNFGGYGGYGGIHPSSVGFGGYGSTFFL